MRIPLDRMLRPVQRLLFRFVTLAVGHKSLPVLLVSYRKDFFGDRFDDCLDVGMRGAKHWTRGELELFASFVSRLNSCGY